MANDSRAAGDRGRSLELQDYMQHAPWCAKFRCLRCHEVKDSDLHYVGTPDSHQFADQLCDCGLDSALAALASSSSDRGISRERVEELRSFFADMSETSRKAMFVAEVHGSIYDAGQRKGEHCTMEVFVAELDALLAERGQARPAPDEGKNARVDG